MVSQNSTELGVGYKRTLKIRMGCPRSTRINVTHIITEEMARNSPRMVTLPKAL